MQFCYDNSVKNTMGTMKFNLDSLGRLVHQLTLGSRQHVVDGGGSGCVAPSAT